MVGRSSAGRFSSLPEVEGGLDAHGGRLVDALDHCQLGGMCLKQAAGVAAEAGQQGLRDFNLLGSADNCRQQFREIAPRRILGHTIGRLFAEGQTLSLGRSYGEGLWSNKGLDVVMGLLGK